MTPPENILRDWPLEYGFETSEIQASDGTRIFFCAGGPKDAPPVILLHGAPQSSYSWRHVMRLLKDRYRVIAPDLRGYGASDLAVSGRYDVDILTDDLRAVVDSALAASGKADANRADVDPEGQVRIVAHDWGGPIAWRFAELYPARVRHIVAANAPHGGAYIRQMRSPRQLIRSWYIGLFTIPKIEALLERDHASFFIKMMERSSAPGTFSEPDLRIYRAGLDRPGRAEAVLAYYRQVFGRGFLERARQLLASPRIQVPATIVWGNNDMALSPKHPDATRAFVEHLEIRRLGGVSHWVPEERPEEIARAVLDKEEHAAASPS